MYVLMKLSSIVSTKTLRLTPWQRATGLMFKKKLVDEAYVFAFDSDVKIPIHMLFVFFRIDVLWVNSDHEIVDLRRNVLPFTPSVFHKGRAKYLIELPAGTISEHKLRLMSQLDVEL